MSEEQENFTFVVFGDPQMHNDITRQIVDMVAQEKAEFCLILGDLVNDANDLTQWEQYRKVFRPLYAEFPLYTVPGNHDYQLEGRIEHYKAYAHSGDTYYSFNHKGCRFFMLDTFLEGPLSETRKADEGAFQVGHTQYSWLERGLMSASQEDETVFVALHHPVFMAMSLYFSTSPMIRVDDTIWPPTFGNLVPLLMKYNVQMAFGGHIHVYEHCIHSEIDFITTGATGFELFRPEGTVNGYRVRAEARHHYCRIQVWRERIILEAIDIEGEVFDRIERRRKPDNETLDLRL